MTPMAPMTPMTADISRLRRFVVAATELAERVAHDEDRMVAGMRNLLADLVSADDWLPDSCAVPGETYRQYLLHCDPLQRFSVVSFVWGPGQTTPVHDHTVWGLIGMLRGAETGCRYTAGPDGALVAGTEERLDPGDIDMVSPSFGDIHTVSNACADRPSVSIHVYGANIGAVRRHVFDPRTGVAKDFVSGYSNESVPNLWDLSAG